MKKKEEKIEVNASDIRWQFVFGNYKGFPKFNKSIEDHEILVVSGDNEKGKTSLIVALQEAYLGKSLTPEPLTRGKKEGFKEIQIVDKDGNPVMVKHTFNEEDQKGKFVLYNAEGKAFRLIKEFKEILGEYFDISVPEFFELAKTDPGKREIMDKYLIKCLPEKDLKRLAVIDAKIHPDSGELFNNRTKVGANKSHYEELCKKEEFSQAELSVLENGEEAIRQLDKWKETQEKYKNIETARSILSLNIKTLEGLKDGTVKWTSEEYKQTIADKFDDLITDVNKSFMSYQDIDEEKIKLADTKVVNGEKYVSNYKSLLEAQKSTQENKKMLKDFTKEYDALTKEIEELREEKKKIFTEAPLPEGLKMDENKFTLDGFDFSDKQVSFSKASLAIIEMMFKISEAKIVVGGQVGDYGEDRLLELTDLAATYGRTIILSKVESGQDDVKIVGLTNVDITAKGIKAVEEKPTEKKKTTTTTTSSTTTKEPKNNGPKQSLF